jgi:hypothetical protein
MRTCDECGAAAAVDEPVVHKPHCERGFRRPSKQTAIEEEPGTLPGVGRFHVWQAAAGGGFRAPVRPGNSGRLVCPGCGNVIALFESGHARCCRWRFLLEARAYQEG